MTSDLKSTSLPVSGSQSQSIPSQAASQRIGINEVIASDPVAARLNQLAPAMHLSIKQQQQLCDYAEDEKVCRAACGDIAGTGQSALRHSPQMHKGNEALFKWV